MMNRCISCVRSSGLLVAAMMAAGFNLLAMAQATAADSQEDDGKLRIIAFGAIRTTASSSWAARRRNGPRWATT